jgi:hypothetical protein
VSPSCFKKLFLFKGDILRKCLPKSKDKICGKSVQAGVLKDFRGINFFVISTEGRDPGGPRFVVAATDARKHVPPESLFVRNDNPASEPVCM